MSSRIASVAAIAVAILTTPALVAATPAAQTAPANQARAAAENAKRVFHDRMVARHAQRGTAQAQLAPTGNPGGFEHFSHVQQASRDTIQPLDGAEPDTQVGPTVAVDPNNPKVMTVGLQQGRYVNTGAVDVGYATSQDGGHTWASGNLPKLTVAVGGPFERASDPAVAFGPDGAVYVQTMAYDVSSGRSALAVQRSDDGGLSFGDPVLVVDTKDGSVFHDKNWIGVDTGKNSPHRGRIYSVWSMFSVPDPETWLSPVMVSYSDDRGQSWSKPISVTAPNVLTEGVLPLIQRDGSITVIYDWSTEGYNDYETAQTSRDGGLTWSNPVKISRFVGGEVPGMRTGGVPAAAVDPTTDQLYAVWQDTQFNAEGFNDILLTTSRDGVHWSPAVVVSPVVAGLNRFTPVIAANGGAVHIAYRTRAQSGTAPTVSTNYLVSTDRGVSFGREREVGPRSTLTYAATTYMTFGNLVPDPSKFLGDYMGIAATPTSAVLTWCVSAAPPMAGQPSHQTTWTAVVVR